LDKNDRTWDGTVNIIWTRHAEERQREWQKKLSITREEVERVLMNPEQVVLGDLGTYVAQAKRANGLLRVPYTELQGARKILTLYWTSKVTKYWKGG